MYLVHVARSLYPGSTRTCPFCGGRYRPGAYGLDRQPRDAQARPLGDGRYFMDSHTVACMRRRVRLHADWPRAFRGRSRRP
jgi:hypothetical protein